MLNFVKFNSRMNWAIFKLELLLIIFLTKTFNYFENNCIHRFNYCSSQFLFVIYYDTNLSLRLIEETTSDAIKLNQMPIHFKKQILKKKTYMNKQIWIIVFLSNWKLFIVCILFLVYKQKLNICLMHIIYGRVIKSDL